MKLKINDKIKQELLKKHYRVVGDHSAIEICSWTKRALLNHEACYKQQFYGVDTHRCAQISPSAVWCNEKCIFCWRPSEYMRLINFEDYELDEPEVIINETLKARKNLLNGFFGNEKVDKELLKESYEKFPSHWAISLSGEPTLYPKLPQLVAKLKENPEVKSVFIVTNGQNPDMFKLMNNTGTLPTQLYLSLDVGNPEKFKEINRPLYKDAWERLIKTIELFPKLETRRVIRFTLIKGLNDSEKDINELVKLFVKTDADFVEIKSYMHLGYSQKRLSKENMPTWEYTKEFSEKVAKHPIFSEKYSFMDENIPSRIIVFRNKNSKYPRFIKKPLF